MARGRKHVADAAPLARAQHDTRRQLAGLSSVVNGLGAWRPAPEVMREVEAVPTCFPQIDAATRVQGWPISRVGVIFGPSAEGKALPDNEPVLTPNGWVRMGDLVSGQQVIGSDGRAIRVTGVFPQGNTEVYELRLDDGSFVRCSGDHLWLTTTVKELNRGRYTRGPRPDRSRQKLGDGRGSVKTTKQISASLSERHYIPDLTGPVCYYKRNEALPIDPYVLGLLLGDGCLSKTTPEVSTNDDAIVEVLKRYVSRLGGKVLVKQYGGRQCMSVLLSRTNLRAMLRSLGLDGCRSWEKFVPEMYKRASVEARCALLRGLFDTDGHASHSGVEYCSSSRALADDVAELVRSLGGRTMVRLKKTSRRDAYVLVAAMPSGIAPFELTRKLAKHRYRRSKPRRRIVAVEKVGFEKCTCIKVDAADGLFVTRGMVLTHNTELLIGLGKSFLARDHLFGFLDLEQTTPPSWAAKLMGEFVRHPGFVALPPGASYEQNAAAVRQFCLGVKNARDEGRVSPDTTGLVGVDSIRKLMPADLLKRISQDIAEPGSRARGKRNGVDGIGGRAAQIKAALNAAWLDELVPLLAETRCAVVFIAREDLDPDDLYADHPKIGGGRAMFYDSSLVVRVTKHDLIEELGGEKVVVGERHIAAIYKSKVAGRLEKRPMAAFHTSNGRAAPEGFWPERDVLELATELGVIELRGSSYMFGKRRIGQGTRGALRRFVEDPSVFIEVETATRAAMKPEAKT